MVRKISSEELSEILRKHELWLNNEDGGERADLSGADLYKADISGANLSGADISGANLSGADISGAYLSRANLSGADISGADLYKADIFGANLSGADISGANLSRADLYKADIFGANLSGADLSGAYLSRANLSGANLSGADISGANLSRANLSGANLSGTDLFCPMACPDTGSFIAWKKVPGPYIVKLLITEDAKRSSATGRKCRCSKAKVIAIENIDGTPSNNVAVHSNYDDDFVYEVGSEVRADDFDENRFNECAPGIHFFINRQEAVNYII